jgi:methanogenic corrinoid protein MtbC1
MSDLHDSSGTPRGDRPFGPDLPPGISREELLAAEVILRVAAQAERRRIADRTPDAAKVAALDLALRSGDEPAAEAQMRAARLAGMPADSLYYELLAPAVKELGEAWTSGKISMGQMMRASNRVWHILRELRHAFVPVLLGDAAHEAAFALCPGECHTIGLTMTADDLRRRGWDIDLVVGMDHEELLARFDRTSPAIVALAASDSSMVLPVARLIVGLRAHLPGVWVLVGGSITNSVADLLEQTGADAVANDAATAERLMEAHLADLAARRVNRP